jgi:hypothetical protein
MRKYVHEVLAEVAKKRSKADKIATLRELSSPALLDVLRATYDDRVVWLIPTDSPPPYTANVVGSIPTDLHKEHMKFKYLVKGPGDGVNPVKRESIFIGMLEGIHPKDATLMINVVSKKPIVGVTKAIVKEAFPNMLPA